MYEFAVEDIGIGRTMNEERDQKRTQEITDALKHFQPPYTGPIPPMHPAALPPLHKIRSTPKRTRSIVAIGAAIILCAIGGIVVAALIAKLGPWNQSAPSQWNRKPRSNTNVVDAVSRGDLARVQSLLQAHPEMANERGWGGQTALHIAVQFNRRDIAQVLLDAGADPNAKDGRGRTPLQMARDPQLVSLLKKYGATGITAFASPKVGEEFLEDISRGDEEKVRASLKEHPDYANAQQDWANHWTVLHDAASEGRLTIAEILLDAGANVNVRNKDGETPLYWAAKKGRTDLARLLLERKADPNLQESIKQRTPLHEAAFRGYQEITELLVANGANINAHDKAGKSPLFYATDEGHNEIVEQLKKAGAKE